MKKYELKKYEEIPLEVNGAMKIRNDGIKLIKCQTETSWYGCYVFLLRTKKLIWLHEMGSFNYYWLNSRYSVI